jgi:hypothetical protein
MFEVLTVRGDVPGSESEFRKKLIFWRGPTVKKDVYETNRWIYWVGFFASHGRLQFHGSPVATDCCNRFQKRCWQMRGISDFRRPQSATLRSGDSRY